MQVAGALAAVAVVRPRVVQGQRWLDGALLAIGAVSLLQLVPIPLTLARALGPERVHIVSSLRMGPPPPLVAASISPLDSLYALAVFVSAVLVFLSARTLFETRGVRDVCRAIAWIGLALSFVAIVERAAPRPLIYGFWPPEQRGGFPFGPFVNRNHCATWLVMAIPVCVGYLLARLGVHGTHHHHHHYHRPSWRQGLDSRTVWLATAGLTMTLALAAALSRSGVGAFAVAALVILVAGRARFDSLRLAWIGGIVVAAVTVWLAFADLPALIDRFGEGVASARLGRIQIWRDTGGLIRDMWLLGSGNGTYATAMLFYQSGSRAYYFNQAHNHLLQVLAEGGILLLGGVVLGLAAFVVSALRVVRRDASRIFWIRIGAAAGLAGVAAQSLWETGLRLPANAQLAAILAALLVHTAAPARRPTDGDLERWT